MQGIDFKIIKKLRALIKNKLTVAGGITSIDEIKELIGYITDQQDVPLPSEEQITKEIFSIRMISSDLQRILGQETIQALHGEIPEYRKDVKYSKEDMFYHPIHGPGYVVGIEGSKKDLIDVVFLSLKRKKRGL